MRPFLAFFLAAAGLTAATAPALAQTVDRYGGYGAYPTAGPAQPAPPSAPTRVLTWPGKTLPTAPPPQAGGYAYPRYMAAQPAGGGALQPAPYEAQRRAASYPGAPAAYYPPAPQGYVQALPAQAYPAPSQQARPVAAYPSPYQAQPYYAPAPRAPAPAPGSTATAPTGVYPPNTVPPQLAYPMAVPPQMAAPLVGQGQQPQPTSIYAAPQAFAPQTELNGSSGLSGQARPNPTDPRQDQRVAMNTAAPAQGARLYSLHREFGLTPDPTPAAPPQGQTVELVSSIDSGAAANPDADAADRPATKKLTDSTGKTVVAQLRGPASSSPDN